MKNNVILIGFMGAGKTSIGTKFARIHHMQFLDTDHLIEQKAGMTIAQIFETQGEEVFRQIETKVLQDLIEQVDHSVISVGGGLPLKENNRKLLKQLGIVVLLSVEAETVLKRLANDTTRPLLQGSDKAQKVKQLLEERMPIYQEAADSCLLVDYKRMSTIIKELEEKVGI